MINKEKIYFNEIKEIETLFNEIHKTFPNLYSIPKPKNLQKEKKKFFQALADDKIYNPQINYIKPKYDLKKLKEIQKKISKINTKNDLYGLKKLYKERLKTKIFQIKYRYYWGNKINTKFVLKYWKKPSFFLLIKAKKFCKNYRRQKIKFFRRTPSQVRKELKLEVQKLTNRKIKTKMVDMAAKVNIEPSNSLIEINKNEKFTSLDIERLKVHEIGVHYMRYFNANILGIKLLETGTNNYLETEEGLAAFSEYKKGVLSQAQMFVYAGRVIATHYCLKKSFYQVYQILRKYGFSQKIAFSITYRTKRNLNDTSQKGGFTKDYVYFKGFYKVKKFAKNNDIKELFIGKIKIEDIKILKKLIDKNKSKIKTIFD